MLVDEVLLELLTVEVLELELELELLVLFDCVLVLELLIELELVVSDCVLVLELLVELELVVIDCVLELDVGKPVSLNVSPKPHGDCPVVLSGVINSSAIRTPLAS